MKDVNESLRHITSELCEKEQNGLPKESPCSEKPIQFGTEKTMKYLFAFFASLYNNAWSSLQDTGEIEKNLQASAWKNILSTMAAEEIKSALDYLKSGEDENYISFPPNPLQFKQIPRKLAEKKFPGMQDCYHAAIKCDWDFHPLVRYAAEKCDVFWLRSQAGAREGMKRFSGHYVEGKEKMMRGESVQSFKNVHTPVSRLEDKEVHGDEEMSQYVPMHEVVTRQVNEFKLMPEYDAFTKADGLDWKLKIMRAALKKNKG